MDTSEPSFTEEIIEEVVEDDPLECPVYEPDLIDYVVYTEGEVLVWSR